MSCVKKKPKIGNDNIFSHLSIAHWGNGANVTVWFIPTKSACQQRWYDEASSPPRGPQVSWWHPSRTDLNLKPPCQACGSPHPALMALPSIDASQGWLWTSALSAGPAGLPGTGTSVVLHGDHLLRGPSRLGFLTPHLAGWAVAGKASSPSPCLSQVRHKTHRAAFSAVQLLAGWPAGRFVFSTNHLRAFPTRHMGLGSSLCALKSRTTQKVQASDEGCC